ncbi:MAG TPA: FkbM family methyltransferase [Vicinamibacterales bacterium]
MSSDEVRHRTLRRVAGGVYALGLRRPIRQIVRPAIHQPWLSLRNRQRLFNFFGEDVAVGETTAVIRLPGGGKVRATLDLSDEFCRTWYYWGYERYEPAVARLIAGLARTKRVILEAGANIGYYTLLMASCQPPGSELHAFEPRPDVFARLSANVALNALPHVRLNRMAVSDVDGTAQLHLPDSGNREMASLDPGFVPSTRSVEVRTTRLDSYWQSEPRTGTPELIKLDVEGVEVRALRGLGALLKDRWPDIVCEVLPGYEPELTAFLRETPYRRYLITEEGLVPRETLTGSHQVRDYLFTTERQRES